MLKKLIAKNFKTHRDIELEFHPNVNVIWGIGGSGKTNIMRMVYWLRTNKPKFERVHSHFAKGGETSVQMVFDNGTAELSKDAKTNTYTLNCEQSYSYTGSAVPESILRLLNLNEINFSKQLDPHFLITSTPGDIGKTINRITKIEKMDDWIAKLTTMSNTTKSKIIHQQNDVDELEKELVKYEGIEDLDASIKEYGHIGKYCEEVSDTIARLYALKKKLIDVTARIGQLQEMEKVLSQSFEEIEGVVQEESICREHILHLTESFHILTHAVKKIRILEDILREEENFKELEIVEHDIQECRAYKETIQEYQNISIRFTNKQIQVTEMKENYLKAIEKLGTCPVCQNVISLEHIHNLGVSL